MNVLQHYLQKKKTTNPLNPFYSDIEAINLYYSKFITLNDKKELLSQELKEIEIAIYNKKLFINQLNWSKVINEVLNINGYKKQGIIFIAPKGMRIRCNKFIKSDLFHNTLQNQPELLEHLNHLQLEFYTKYKVVQQFSKKESKFFYKNYKNKNHDLFFMKNDFKEKNNELFELNRQISLIKKQLTLITKMKATKFLEYISLNDNTELFNKIAYSESLNLSDYFKQFNFIKDSLDGMNYFLKELGRVEIDYILNQKSIGRDSGKINIKIKDNRSKQYKIDNEEIFLLILIVGICNFKNLYPLKNRYYSNRLKIESAINIFETVLKYYIS